MYFSPFVIQANTEKPVEVIRPYSATSNCQKHKQLRQKYGTIGAREKAKTMEKACT